jgi:Clp amino terminal domain, pathogenicity island component
MFERYTERARRVIFVARYEAVQLGSTTIETEHLLLGVIREDKNLTNRFGDVSFSEHIRTEIERQTTIREKVSHSIDIPLSDQCKRILAYAVEEADLLSHPLIGTEHLLLGILREEKCMAAQILNNRGLRLNKIREELAISPFPLERPTTGIPNPVIPDPPLDKNAKRSDKADELSREMLEIKKGIEEITDEFIASLPREERAEFIKELAEQRERLQIEARAAEAAAKKRQEESRKRIEAARAERERQEQQRREEWRKVREKLEAAWDAVADEDKKKMRKQIREQRLKEWGEEACRLYEEGLDLANAQLDLTIDLKNWDRRTDERLLVDKLMPINQMKFEQAVIEHRKKNGLPPLPSRPE